MEQLHKLRGISDEESLKTVTDKRAAQHRKSVPTIFARRSRKGTTNL